MGWGGVRVAIIPYPNIPRIDMHVPWSLHHSNFLPTFTNLACVAGKLKKTQEEANIAKMEIQEKKDREKKASSDKKELAS